MPILSVVIPCYNASSTIEECVLSVMDQSLPDLEIIVVDDGSTDDSLAICRRLAEEDERISVYTKKNAGQGIARNFGMSHATGEYIAFVDADDTCNVEMYRALINSAKEFNADLVFSGYRDIKDGKVVEEHPIIREVLQYDAAIRQHMADLIASSAGNVGSCCVAVWDGIFRLSLLRKNGIEFPSERAVYSEDLVFKLRALASSNTVSFLPDSYYEYHISESSYSKCADLYVIDKLVSMYKIIEREFSKTLDEFCFSSRNASRLFASLRFALRSVPLDNGRLPFFRAVVSNQDLRSCLALFKPNSALDKLIYRTFMKKEYIILSLLFLCFQLKGYLK